MVDLPLLNLQDHLLERDERLSDGAYVGHYEGVKWIETKTFTPSDPESVIQRYLEMFSDACTVGGLSGTAEVGPCVNPISYACLCDACVGMAAENLMQRARSFHFSVRNKNVLEIIAIAKRDAAKARAVGQNASDAYEMTAATLTSNATLFFSVDRSGVHRVRRTTESYIFPSYEPVRSVSL